MNKVLNEEIRHIRLSYLICLILKQEIKKSEPTTGILQYISVRVNTIYKIVDEER